MAAALLTVVVAACSTGDGREGAHTTSTPPATATESPPAAPRDSSYRTSLTRWRASDGNFATWSGAGAEVVAGGELALDRGTAVAETDPYPAGAYLRGNFYNAGTYVVGETVSPVTPTTIGFSEAIASWNAQTPPGTWIEAQVRARVDGGRFTRFYNLGVWAADSSTIERHSVRDQRDADGSVEVDTLVLDDRVVADAFQLKFRLFSSTPGTSPSVRSSAVVVSTPVGGDRPAVPGDRSRWGSVLRVPECSQAYPDGGEGWCSPTSTSMVLAYWSGATGPCEPRVRAAVDGVFDRVFDGHGNWPFNTAHAGTVGLETYVDRLTSLADVEPWIAAGVPVVVSYSWRDGSLTGAPVPASDGHLAVIVGFDAAGDPIVNDPAARVDGDVQRTYLRSELEDLWVTKSGGVAYFMYPPGHPVPAS